MPESPFLLKKSQIVQRREKGEEVLKTQLYIRRGSAVWNYLKIAHVCYYSPQRGQGDGARRMLW